MTERKHMSTSKRIGRALKLEHLKEEILQMFDSGMNVTEISKQLGEYLQPVSTLVKKYRNLPSLSMQGTADFRYFQNIDTHLKAYFLGFIAGDGCLVSPRPDSLSMTLTITIHEKDEMILEKLRTELKMSRPLYRLPVKNHVRLVLTNRELTEDLMKHGIHPRKSLTMENVIPLIPKEFRASWILGYFDADGSITVRHHRYLRADGVTESMHLKHAVQIRGTKALLEGIIHELGIETYHIATNDGIPNLAIGSRVGIKKFHDAVYRDCDFYLARKYDKFSLVPSQDQTISSSSN